MPLYYNYRNVPVEALHGKILDESLATKDYELLVVTTDILVTLCPANASVTFTETEVNVKTKLIHVHLLQ